MIWGHLFTWMATQKMEKAESKVYEKRFLGFKKKA